MGLIVLIIAGFAGLVAFGWLHHNFPGQAAQVGHLTTAAARAMWAGFQRAWHASIVRFCLAAGKYAMAVQGVTIVLDLAGAFFGPVTIPWWAHGLIIIGNLVGMAFIAIARQGHRVLLDPLNPAAGFRMEYSAADVAGGVVNGLLVSGGTMVLVSGLDPVQSSYVAFGGIMHLAVAAYVVYAVGYAVAQLVRFAIKAGEFSADLLRGLPLAAYTGNWGRVQEAFERTNWANEDGIPPAVTEIAKEAFRAMMSLFAMTVLMPWWPIQATVVILGVLFWDTRMPPPVFLVTRGVLAVAMLMRMFHPQGAAMQGAFLAAVAKLVGYTLTKTTGVIDAIPGVMESKWSLPALEPWPTVGAMAGLLGLAVLLYVLYGKASGLFAKGLGAAVGLVGGLFVVLCVITAGNLFAVAVPATASSLAKPASAPVRTSPPSTATATPVPSIHTVGGSPAPVTTTRAASRPAAPARQAPRPVPVANGNVPAAGSYPCPSDWPEPRKDVYRANGTCY